MDLPRDVFEKFRPHDMPPPIGLGDPERMFQDATSIPLLVRLPGQSDAARITGPVSQIDRVPTLLNLCGAEGGILDHLPGQSLAGLCRRGASGAHPELATKGETVFLEWHASRINPVNIQACKVDARTVITKENYRYTIYADGQEELYDLNSDPIEMVNLARDPTRSHLISELKNQLIQWKNKTNDMEPFPQFM